MRHKAIHIVLDLTLFLASFIISQKAYSLLKLNLFTTSFYPTSFCLFQDLAPAFNPSVFVHLWHHPLRCLYSSTTLLTKLLKFPLSGVLFKVHSTLEQNGFELCRSSHTQMFFNSIDRHCSTTRFVIGWIHGYGRNRRYRAPTISYTQVFNCV